MDDLATQILSEALRRAFADIDWLLGGVDDGDCFWEPTTPCWSVRPRADAGPGWGTGEFVCEEEWWPRPDPLRVTSIAWRAAHVAGWTDVYRAWAFEDERPMLTDFEVPGTRDGLVRWVHDSQEEFARHVDALTPDDLAALRPAHWGEDVPLHRLVALISYEHTHHGAEIGALRDLHRGHAREQPPPPTS